MIDDPATWCPGCGPSVRVDEDGCCLTCGATAMGEGAVEALRLRLELETCHAALREIARRDGRTTRTCNHSLVERMPWSLWTDGPLALATLRATGGE